MNSKISHFTDLIAWQEGHALTLFIYQITKAFPKEEMFRLTNQICRSSSSITANIAEGFSRNSEKEKKQFYYISLGSLTETQNHLILARDLKYISSEDFNHSMEKIILTSKLIHGLIKSADGRV